MSGKTDAGNIAKAFEDALKEEGWKKSYPKSPSVDKAYFTKGEEKIVRRGNGVYVYREMALKIENGEAVPYYDDSVVTHLPSQMEILQCMKKAEELVKLNG